MIARARRLAMAGGTTAALWMSACSNPSGPSTPLTLTRFRTGASSFASNTGYDQPQTIVIHDRDTYVRAWADIFRRTDPPPPIPEVDFASEMVLVAALGNRPSSGYEVIFTGASEAGGVVTVEVESRSPGPGCVTLTVITSPVDLARIPRRNGAIVFHTTPVVVNCP